MWDFCRRATNFSLVSFSLSNLFIGLVDQFEACGLPHRKTQAVNGVQGGAQEAAEPELLPQGQPAVQPVGETTVLGAPPQLEVGGAQTGQVNQCQRHQGHRGEAEVHSVDGHFVESVLPRRDVGMQDVPGEVVEVEEDEQRQGADEGDAPGGKQIERLVLNLQRRRKEARVNGDKTRPVTDLFHRVLGLLTVAAQKNLQKTE